MSLNIKNEETCRLAAELARLTGETKTGAITVALRERLEREGTGPRHRGAASGYARCSGALCEADGSRAIGSGARRFPL